MNKNNAYRKKGQTTIKSQFCNSRPKKVNCCPEKQIKTEKSSSVLSPCSKIESADPKFRCPENQTKTEKSSNVLSPCSNIESDSKSGCWIPNASKGECGFRLTDERVVGGEVARLGEFPYVALLGYLIGNEIFYLCGGSILNGKYVLTAAHCHSSKQPIR